MTILGIDPGTKRVGYGVIKKDGGRLRLVAAGILKVGGGSPGALLDIKNEISKIIVKFKPEIAAIEKLYFAKNQKTAMGVAEARGVILLTALESGLKIHEYSPNEVKSGIAGHGLADKRAVLKMVRLILNEPGLKVIDDASDALALAVLSTSRGPLDRGN